MTKRVRDSRPWSTGSGAGVTRTEDLHPYECWHDDRCSECVREREHKKALVDAENNHGDGI